MAAMSPHEAHREFAAGVGTLLDRFVPKDAFEGAILALGTSAVEAYFPSGFAGEYPWYNSLVDIGNTTMPRRQQAFRVNISRKVQDVYFKAEMFSINFQSILWVPYPEVTGGGLTVARDGPTKCPGYLLVHDRQTGRWTAALATPNSSNMAGPVDTTGNVLSFYDPMEPAVRALISLHRGRKTDLGPGAPVVA